VAAGADPKTIAQRAGHTSVRVVLDVYAGLYPESEAGLRERLAAAYQPPSEPPAGEMIEAADASAQKGGQVISLER
jgi:hypothetical protein